MSAPTTTEEFLDLVRKSELVSPQRLDPFTVQACAAAPAMGPREMATLMIAAGLLTRFQAEQFLQGKWRGFAIGKYKVLERIGAGGMGTVYLAEHMTVGRRVAIKVLPTSQAENPSALGRFYREARAAGVLDHPNLVRAHDVDEDNGLHFLVMDYVDGSNLQEIVSRTGPMPAGRAAHYAHMAARGLQHAHLCGLIHRDVKPANILVERNGNVRLLDLGLARFFHDQLDNLTLKYDNKNVLGTADYVAPEQALNSHEVDTRADIYSLGGTLYFCLVGRAPFPTGTVAQKLIWHQTRQPTPLLQLRPDLDPELAAVVNRMMAKNPSHRYQNPAEVADALAPWLDTPIPLPTEQEMPQLCPALAPGAAPAAPAPPGGPRSMAGPARSRTVPAAFGHRSPPTASLLTLPGPGAGSDHLLAADRPPTPSAADMATPRLLASHEPTDTEHPTPPPTPAPFAVMANFLAGRAPLPVRVAVMAVGGALAGLALSYLVHHRF